MHQNLSLDTQLDAYAQRAGRRSGRKTAAEIFSYTAAAGGLAFAGGDAMGAIIHNTTGVTFSTVNTTNYFDWDIDGNGGKINVWLDAGSTNNNDVAFENGVVANTASYGAVSDLANGFLVQAGLATGVFGTYWGYILDDITRNSAFMSQTAYLGFQFTGTTGTPGTQYGWAKARVEEFGTGLIGTRLILSEWAFDDSGAAITVGDTGASVPAPATPLLVLLGMGAMGVQGYRRRRDQGLKRLADEQADA